MLPVTAHPERAGNRASSGAEQPSPHRQGNGRRVQTRFETLGSRLWPARLARRFSEAFAVAGREMRLAGEAAEKRDLLQAVAGAIGGEDLPARFLEPELHQLMAEGRAMHLEQLEQIAQR